MGIKYFKWLLLKYTFTKTATVVLQQGFPKGGETPPLGDFRNLLGEN